MECLKDTTSSSSSLAAAGGGDPRGGVEKTAVGSLAPTAFVGVVAVTGVVVELLLLDGVTFLPQRLQKERPWCTE